MVVRERCVEPEILDTLAEDDPAAWANRRDILRINHLQGNFRWFAWQLRARQAREGILELGAGQGELGLYLVKKNLLAADQPHYCGLDLWPRPAAWPPAWGWHSEDALAFTGYRDYPIITANLLLHQFADDALHALGLRLQAGARGFLFCEPLRSRRACWGMAGLCLLGANYVSRHDGFVSIRAGFRGVELPERLGLDSSDWQITVEETPLGACRLAAWRK